MIHPHTALRHIGEDMGMGVFATRDIPCGTFIVVRDPFDLIMSRETYENLPHAQRAAMETHMYCDPDGSLVLSWDHAKYMNHNCAPNTMMTGYGLEVVVRDIAAGEEITTEYGLLNVQEPYELCCGCPDCRERLRLDDLETHCAGWDRTVHRALLAARQVDQPLWEVLPPHRRDMIRSLWKGTAEYASLRVLKWNGGCGCNG